jgi:hypothetical protein
MHAYLYASTIDPDVYAFSVQPADGNLPTDHAPWRRLNGGSSMLVGPTCLHILKALEQDGYYLMTGGPDGRL